MNIQILSACAGVPRHSHRKILQILLPAIFLPAMLGACATQKQLYIGASEAQVIDARGQPTRRHRVNDKQLLEYNHGPFGQRTYMATLDANGRLISFEQVLTEKKFALLKPGESTKANVLYLIGSPSEQSFLPLPRLEVWSYPYKQYDLWNAIMHVHFDQSGIVRKLVNTPDTRFNTRDGNVFGAFPW